MELIPQYQILDFGIRSPDLSPIYNAIAGIKKQQDQDKRTKQLQIQEQVDKMDVATSKLKGNQENAAKLIEDFQNDYAHALTFNENGKESGKLKTIFGQPQLTDKENIDLMHKAAEVTKQIQTLKQYDDAMSNDQEMIKRNPEKFDAKLWSIKEADYQATGIYKGDGLDVAPANPMEILNNSYATKFLGYNEKEGQTQDILPNGKIVTKKAPLDENTQLAAYNKEADTNPALQKGLVDNFMYDKTTTLAEKKAYMFGNLVPHNMLVDPKISDQTKQTAIMMAKQHIDKAFEDYDVSRKFDPYLTETAKNYGSHVSGFHKNLGSGWSNEDLDLTGIHQRENDARDAAKKATEEAKTNTPLVPMTQRFGGHDYNNFISLSGTEPSLRTISNFNLPKETVKYVKRVNPKTGETIEVNGRKQTQVTNPVETKSVGDYEVIGYDKAENKIMLTKPRPITQEGETGDEVDQEIYVIPLTDKTRFMVQDFIKKEQGKNADINKDSGLSKKKIEGF